MGVAPRPIVPPTEDVSRLREHVLRVLNDHHFAFGDGRRFGMKADGSTDNTNAFQSALDEAAGIAPVLIYPGASYYKLVGRVTAPANTMIVLIGGAELRWTATTANGSNFLGAATRPGIEVTGDKFTLTGQGKLTGPSAASYVANEVAIFSKGTSSLVRRTQFWIEGEVEIHNWGYGGVLGQFLDDTDVSGALVHDCGYLGIMFLSSGHGSVQRCHVHTITPGTDGNAYGISLTHDSTDYDLDDHVDGTIDTNGRLAVNPFCNDWDISANVVHDVVLWTGIDAHGGYELTVHDNAVYNCRHGILLGGGSGDAANYGGEAKCVRDNFITTRKRDGTATGVTATDRYGIIVNGGTTVRSRDCHVLANVVEGYGDAVVSSYPIEATFVDAAQIRGNVIRDWRGKAIYTAQGNGIIADNIIEGVNSATNSACVMLDTGSTVWNVHDNKHKPRTGTAAAEGLRVTAGVSAQNVHDNDFSAATTPYAGDRTLMGGLSLAGTYTNANRPAANTFPAGSMIWNSDDVAPNFSDGANWFDAAGGAT